MIVCLCNVASRDDIANAIGHGAHSVEQVGSHCGAGTGCGACHDYIRDMLEQARATCPGGGCQDCPRGSREAA